MADLLSTTQAARILNITPQAVTARHRKGTMESHSRLITGDLRFTFETIAAALADKQAARKSK